MAVAYLNDGATSLAAANWTDATGFANAATLIIDKGSATSFTNVDQSALGTGIDYLYIRRGFSGALQDAAGAPLKVDADGGSVNAIVYGAGGGLARIQAGGGSTLITNIENSGAGALYLVGGTFTNAFLASGTTDINGSSVVTNLYVTGGTNTVAYNATALTIFEQTAGVTTLKRGVATGRMNGGTLILDFDDAGTGTGTFGSTAFEWNGGTIILKNGNISNFTWRGGSLDLSMLRRDVTIGGTSFVIYPHIEGYLNTSGNSSVVTWQTATKRGSVAGSSQLYGS